MTTAKRTLKLMIDAGYLTIAEASTAWGMFQMIGEDSPEALDSVLDTMGSDVALDVYDFWAEAEGL